MMTIEEVLHLACAFVLGFSLSWSCWNYSSSRLTTPTSRRSGKGNHSSSTDGGTDDDFSVLDCIRHRQSCFPSTYAVPNPSHPCVVSTKIIDSLLEAALWAPFHGKCYKGQGHPARFVVLGKESMVEMQRLTLAYYDQHWQEGWGSGTKGSFSEYQKWRKMTEEEITGRWGPVSYMIAIVMRRQAGPKRLPEWEEAAAVAAAVQNMHLQSTKFPQLACYWSSWHERARDSSEFQQYLRMNPEDKCMGLFIVAQKYRVFRDRRKRDKSLMAVEWRA